MTAPDRLGEVAHQLGQIAATLDEVHAAVDPGEGALVLPGRVVAGLRAVLGRCGDATVPVEARAAARIELVAYLDGVLDTAPGERTGRL